MSVNLGKLEAHLSTRSYVEGWVICLNYFQVRVNVKQRNIHRLFVYKSTRFVLSIHSWYDDPNAMVRVSKKRLDTAVPRCRQLYHLAIWSIFSILFSPIRSPSHTFPLTISNLTQIHPLASRRTRLQSHHRSSRRIRQPCRSTLVQTHSILLLRIRFSLWIKYRWWGIHRFGCCCCREEGGSGRWRWYRSLWERRWGWWGGWENQGWACGCL